MTAHLEATGKRKTSCSCGQLTVTTTGDPVRISICHCLACQRRTGSVFGAQARFPLASVEIEGRASTYVRKGDSGNLLRFRFCPDCGATVYYLLDSMPDRVGVPIGGFGDPAFPRPRFSVYEARRHEWVTVPDDVEHLDLGPPKTSRRPAADLAPDDRAPRRARDRSITIAA